MLAVARGASEGDRPFDPTKISPSRVNALVSCGVAFKMKYLDKMPEEVSGSAALFGRVVHKSLEDWAPNREQDLLPLMRQAWLHETAEAPVIAEFLSKYQPISTEVIKAEHAARKAFDERPDNIRAGKTCQAPRMTGHFKKSAAYAKLTALVEEWVPKLNAGSPWRFNDRDPLPTLYDESLVLAKRYERNWRHLPPAMHTEFAFDVPWRGFRLTGYIDTIERLIVRDTGEFLGVGINDYKTYRADPAPNKDYRQKVIYDAAVRELVAQGVLDLPLDDLFVVMDYVRLGRRDVAKVTPADHDRLERELIAYRNTVESENFLPAEKGRNPDFCPYPSNCCLRNCSAAGGGLEHVEVNL